MEDEVLRVELGLDALRSASAQELSLLDLLVPARTLLLSIHHSLISILHLQHSADLIRYYSADSPSTPLDLSQSLNSLGIQDGSRIIADLGRKRKRYQLFDEENHNSTDDNTSDELLHLICSTRIFSGEDVPLKEVRVIVRRNQPCKYLMEDVSTLWNRPNLKFRYGRITLCENKTYGELGIESDGKVVVTGGRG
jgi:hypothetical protein